jgi:hypothetical protein
VNSILEQVDSVVIPANGVIQRHVIMGKALSTREMIRLIVVAALDLVVLREAWTLLAFPPITLTVVALNLGLWFVWIRPKDLGPRAVGAMLGALVALPLSMSLFHPHYQKQIVRTIGAILDGPLEAIQPAGISRFGLVMGIAYVAFDLVGLMLILAGASLAGRLRQDRRARANTR